MYKGYKTHCEEANRPFASFVMYRQILNYEFNLEFWNRKRISVTYLNLIKTLLKKKKKIEFQPHCEGKNFSGKEKENDKERVDDSHRVACFDLQAPLQTPIGNISTFYYKIKPLNYNFTFCDLQKKGLGNVHCHL